MTASLGVGGIVELATVERSGFDESRHLGAAVLTGRDGLPVRELGDSGALVFPRSCLKPFQAVATLRSGARLSGPHLAVAAASHVGTPAHVALVRDILRWVGLDESALRCVASWPADPTSRTALIAAGERPRPITMSCSGKHAGFLAACVARGWATENYLEPAHPVQVLVREVVEELTGHSVQVSGIDGCGAPLYATTLAGIASGVSGMVRGARPSGQLGAAITDAALANAWVIEGPGRPDTLIIQELGLFAKYGAEGFMLVAARTGETAAVKIMDGSPRAAALVALELLAQGGVLEAAAADRVKALVTPSVTGGGEVVGTIRAAF